MSTEELLKPRIKVTSDWPGRRDFEVGQIITLDKVFGDGSPMYELEDCQGVRTYIKAFFEMFPLQFKFLEWWEDRKPEEMPEYVWYDQQFNKKVIPLKVKEWVKEADEDIWAKVEGDKIGFSAFYMQPATEQEYNDFLNR